MINFIVFTRHALTYVNVYALRSDDKDKPAWETIFDDMQKVDDEPDEKTRVPVFWHCIQCHHPITQKDATIEVNGQHQHTFTNPHGYVYRIGCFSDAPGCVPVSQPTTTFSWFPGYAWQIVVCHQCQHLLGWAFQGKGDHFWGLILSQLA